MSDPVSRPFYDEYAWAYDLIINPPSEGQLNFIADAFSQRGVGAGSHVLHAGGVERVSAYDFQMRC